MIFKIKTMKKRIIILPLICLFFNLFSQTVIKTNSNVVGKYDAYRDTYVPTGNLIYENVTFTFSADETRLVTTTDNSRTTYILRPFRNQNYIVKNKYIGTDVNGDEYIISYNIEDKSMYSKQIIDGVSYMKAFTIISIDYY